MIQKAVSRRGADDDLVIQICEKGGEPPPPFLCLVKVTV